MHRIDQGLAVPFEFVDHSSQVVGGDRVETEMHVKYVELVAVGGDPPRLEHHGRPPTTRNFPPIRRHRIRQPHHTVAFSRVSEMADVYVRRGYRGHSQHVTPHRSSTGEHSPRSFDTALEATAASPRDRCRYCA